MKCYECGGNYHKKHGRFIQKDKSIGDYYVDDVMYYECDNCSSFLLPPVTCKKLEREREKIIQQYVKNNPIDAFVSASQAAKILGISRQAFSKHRRIKKGFIYKTKLGGKTFYLKTSVDQFKRTGDGRIPLSEPTTQDRFTGIYTYSPLEYSSVQGSFPKGPTGPIGEDWQVTKTHHVEGVMMSEVKSYAKSSMH